MLESDTLCGGSVARFDIMADKGTLDAVGLSPGGEQKRVQYIKAAHQLLNFDGLLIITSCNSTSQELQVHALAN